MLTPLRRSSGAKVIATTSSKEKAETLKKLGVNFVINYKETPEWGAEAKKITNGEGSVVPFVSLQQGRSLTLE